jgi:PleD family two-component response regulator
MSHQTEARMLVVQQHQTDRKHDRVILNRAAVDNTDAIAHEEDRMLAVDQNLKTRNRQKVALSRSVPEAVL